MENRELKDSIGKLERDRVMLEQGVRDRDRDVGDREREIGKLRGELGRLGF